jgi:hypothetical protein
MEHRPIPLIRRAHPADLQDGVELVHTVWHEHEARFVPEVIHPYRTKAFFAERLAAMEGLLMASDENGLRVGVSAWQSNYLDFLMVRAALSRRRHWDGSPDGNRRGNEAGAVPARHPPLHDWKLGCTRFYEKHGWRWAGEVEIQVPLGSDRMKQTRWRMEKALKI